MTRGSAPRPRLWERTWGTVTLGAMWGLLAVQRTMAAGGVGTGNCSLPSVPFRGAEERAATSHDVRELRRGQRRARARAAHLPRGRRGREPAARPDHARARALVPGVPGPVPQRAGAGLTAPWPGRRRSSTTGDSSTTT